MNSRLPPLWDAEGQAPFLLGTDEQGRDILSAILYGLRISLLVGFLGVAFSATLGIGLGLVAGYFGGIVDTVIMRIADVQLTFPAILIALLVDGVVKAVLGGQLDAGTTLAVLVVLDRLELLGAICAHGARLGDGGEEQGLHRGRPPDRPAGPVDHGPAHPPERASGRCSSSPPSTSRSPIITEATLSFLGSGMPETMPSLGTLIRIGNNYLFSGEWWIVAFPGFALAALVLAINLLGDWLRDALNPRLR